MEKSKIKILLEIGLIDSRSMSLKIFDKDNLLFHKNSFDSNKEYLQLSVDFPSQLTFVTEGKGSDDTIVGPDQAIISDMYIKIIKLSIDLMPVKSWILEKFLFSGQDLSGSKFSTNYIGYNGSTVLDLNYPNSFDFFLDIMSRS
jgi:hypothetical protein